MGDGKVHVKVIDPDTGAKIADWVTDEDGNHHYAETFTELQKECWAIAEEHGFHGVGRTVGDVCALIHSEVSEAFESFRTSGVNDWVEVDGKPKGFWTEIADVVIRCMDVAGDYDVDLARVIRHKMEYNRRRPFLHGKSI